MPLRRVDKSARLFFVRRAGRGSGNEKGITTAKICIIIRTSVIELACAAAGPSTAVCGSGGSERGVTKPLPVLRRDIAISHSGHG